MKRALIACLALLCVDGVSVGQDHIDATVVSVSGRSVYINVGRNLGVAPGARVVFRLRNGDQVAATVVDVSSNNARAELEDGTAVPSTDDRAMVDVESPAPEGTAASAEPSRAIPEHPPWRAQLDPNAKDAPLLSPAFGAAPNQQPTTIRGRVFTTFRNTQDLQNDNSYIYARAGLWFEARNPFNDGGRILFRGDSTYQGATGPYFDSDELEGRIQRFSYAWGLDQNAPFRGEIGRFFSYYLPELGIVDGAEGAFRFDGGVSIGAGAGYYPTTTEDLFGGDDYGFHVFADYQPDGLDRTLQATLGFQQTFHQGEADRSVVIGRFVANPSDDLRLFGLVKVDLYDSNDSLESGTAEVTQAFAQASFRFSPSSGANISYVHTSWPELKRSEFALMPPELVSDGYVDRVSTTLWTRFDKNWRGSLRGYYWKDQSRDGYGGEAGVDWSLPTAVASSLFASVYYEDAAYTTGFGVRLQAQADLGDFMLFVGYDGFAYTTDTVVPGQSEYIRNSIRGDIGWGSGPWWWDIDATYNFGDYENSIAIGISAEYRF